MMCDKELTKMCLCLNSGTKIGNVQEETQIQNIFPARLQEIYDCFISLMSKFISGLSMEVWRGVLILK